MPLSTVVPFGFSPCTPGWSDPPSQATAVGVPRAHLVQADLELMKLLPRVEVFKQETKRLSVSCVVSMRPKSFESAMDRLASWATRAFSNPASSAAAASLGSRHGRSLRCRGVPQLPQDPNPIALPHRSSTVLRTHGEELAALRVGQKVSELDRHAWFAAHAPFFILQKKNAAAQTHLLPMPLCPAGRGDRSPRSYLRVGDWSIYFSHLNALCARQVVGIEGNWRKNF